jgi:hypothetical protein
MARTSEAGSLFFDLLALSIFYRILYRFPAILYRILYQIFTLFRYGVKRATRPRFFSDRNFPLHSSFI